MCFFRSLKLILNSINACISSLFPSILLDLVDVLVYVRQIAFKLVHFLGIVIIPKLAQPLHLVLNTVGVFKVDVELVLLLFFPSLGVFFGQVLSSLGHFDAVFQDVLVAFVGFEDVFFGRGASASATTAATTADRTAKIETDVTKRRLYVFETLNYIAILCHSSLHCHL